MEENFSNNNTSNLYDFSWIYITSSALLFVVAKNLCLWYMMEDFTVLIWPLGFFCLLTAAYFKTLINSTIEEDDPKRKRAYLFLASYLTVACLLMYFPCLKYDWVINLFYDTDTFETATWENGMNDSLYESNYRWSFCLVYSGILTAVFLPCIIRAFICLVTEIKKRIVAANSRKEMKKQRRIFFLVYTPTLLLMMPYVIAIFSCPVILFQMVPVLWRKHEKLFWIVESICGLALVAFWTWYFIKRPLLQS